MSRRSIQAFTLVEVLVSTSIFAMITVAMLAFSSTSIRLVARNLSTNHSHETMRISGQTMLRDLHDSASAFRLVDFDGTNYTDTATSATTDQDASTEMYASTRANGVRFRRLAGGPFQLKTSTVSTTTQLTFDFTPPNKAQFYAPQVGDKLVLPLISREYDIAQVLVTPQDPNDPKKPGNPSGTIVISDSAGIGFTLNTQNPDTKVDNVTTAYFYRQVAYSIYQGKLRYHSNFTGANKSNFWPVRDRVTSPKPFSLLYASGSTSSDGLGLRVSMEFMDSDYSARRFLGSAVTLQAVIPPRTRPTPVSTTNAN